MRGTCVLTAMALLLSGAALAQEAENIIKGGDAESGSIWRVGDVKIVDGGEGGGKCFSSKKPATWVGKQRIAISPDKTYTLSASLKSGGKVKSRAYFGFVPYTAKGRQIGPQMVNAYPETSTTLAEDCKKTDKVVRIVDGSQWKAGRHWLIAFDVKEDLSDLPNFHLSSPHFDRLEKKDGYWEIELPRPCGQSYPKGTAVRAQRYGGTYMYALRGGQETPDKWTRCKVKVKGVTKSGARSTQFWPGTAYVELLVLANHGQARKDVDLLVDDISLAESDK